MPHKLMIIYTEGTPGEMITLLFFKLIVYRNRDEENLQEIRYEFKPRWVFKSMLAR